MDSITRRGSADCLGGNQLPSTDPTMQGTVRFYGMNFALVQGVGACYYNPDTGLWHPKLCRQNPPVTAWGNGIKLSNNLVSIFHGNGSPQGVVTPVAEGDLYLDDQAGGALYWNSDGTINGWKP